MVFIANLFVLILNSLCNNVLVLFLVGFGLIFGIGVLIGVRLLALRYCLVSFCFELAYFHVFDDQLIYVLTLVGKGYNIANVIAFTNQWTELF